MQLIVQLRGSERNSIQVAHKDDDSTRLLRCVEDVKLNGWLADTKWDRIAFINLRGGK